MMRVLRPESSVALAIDDYGEAIFTQPDAGPVRHRTPEELGLPRVVLDEAPGKLMPWIDQSAVWKVRRSRETPDGAAQHAARETLKRLDCELSGELSRESSAEQEREEVSAEPAAVGTQVGKRKEEREKAMGMKSMITAEQMAAIKAAPNEGPAALAKRLGVAQHQVFYYREKFKKEAGVKRVTVDATRPGSQASLDRALTRVDVAHSGPSIEKVVEAAVRNVTPVAMVTLELTMDEARGLMAKLSEAQGVAFFQAGLRAALLA